jgi:aminoglycoside phosphotransferase (APT) family kinase protein
MEMRTTMVEGDQWVTNTGTRPVGEVHRINEESLAAYLSKNLPGFTGPIAIEQFNGGQSNPTYRLVTPNHVYVMRAKPGPATRLLPSAHAIEREYRIQQALHGSAVPVPRVLTFCADEAVIGRAFYIMEMVEGRIFWDSRLPGLNSEERSAIYADMNRAMAALHAIRPESVGLSDYGRPGNYYVRQIARWTKQYRASEIESIAAMESLIAWLPDNTPPGDEVAIIHGDFNLANLVFHPTEPRLVAVLDWELSTLGHPLADFAHHCMCWYGPPGPFRGLQGTDLESLGIPQVEEYVKRYCEASGMQGDRSWNLYLAYSFFRLAAVCQGIRKRVLDGTSSSRHADTVGNLVPFLAKTGWHFAERGI